MNNYDNYLSDYLAMLPHTKRTEIKKTASKISRKLNQKEVKKQIERSEYIRSNCGYINIERPQKSLSFLSYSTIKSACMSVNFRAFQNPINDYETAICNGINECERFFYQQIDSIYMSQIIEQLFDFYIASRQHDMFINNTVVPYDVNKLKSYYTANEKYSFEQFCDDIKEFTNKGFTSGGVSCILNLFYKGSVKDSKNKKDYIKSVKRLETNGLFKKLNIFEKNGISKYFAASTLSTFFATISSWKKQNDDWTGVAKDGTSLLSKLENKTITLQSIIKHHRVINELAVLIVKAYKDPVKTLNNLFEERSDNNNDFKYTCSDDEDKYPMYIKREIAEFVKKHKTVWEEIRYFDESDTKKKKRDKKESSSDDKSYLCCGDSWDYLKTWVRLYGEYYFFDNALNQFLRKPSASMHLYTSLDWINKKTICIVGANYYKIGKVEVVERNNQRFLLVYVSVPEMENYIIIPLQLNKYFGNFQCKIFEGRLQAIFKRYANFNALKNNKPQPSPNISVRINEFHFALRSYRKQQISAEDFSKGRFSLISKIGFQMTNDEVFGRTPREIALVKDHLSKGYVHFGSQIIEDSRKEVEQVLKKPMILMGVDFGYSPLASYNIKPLQTGKPATDWVKNLHGNFLCQNVSLGETITEGEIGDVPTDTYTSSNEIYSIATLTFRNADGKLENRSFSRFYHELNNTLNIIEQIKGTFNFIHSINTQFKEIKALKTTEEFSSYVSTLTWDQFIEDSRKTARYSKYWIHIINENPKRRTIATLNETLKLVDEKHRFTVTIQEIFDLVKYCQQHGYYPKSNVMSKLRNLAIKLINDLIRYQKIGIHSCYLDFCVLIKNHIALLNSSTAFIINFSRNKENIIRNNTSKIHSLWVYRDNFRRQMIKNLCSQILKIAAKNKVHIVVVEKLNNMRTNNRNNEDKNNMIDLLATGQFRKQLSDQAKWYGIAVVDTAEYNTSKVDFMTGEYGYRDENNKRHFYCRKQDKTVLLDCDKKASENILLAFVTQSLLLNHLKVLITEDGKTAVIDLSERTTEPQKIRSKIWTNSDVQKIIFCKQENGSYVLKKGSTDIKEKMHKAVLHRHGSLWYDYLNHKNMIEDIKNLHLSNCSLTTSTNSDVINSHSGSSRSLDKTKTYA